MARAVELLEENYGRCRAANAHNVKAINELRAKHEPALFRYPNYRSPPESDG